MPRLLLVASGSEKLKWGNKNLPQLKGQADVTHLPGGHAIDLACGVRYGLIGEPVPAAERMRRYRKRRRNGLRCVRVILHETEIDSLIEKGVFAKATPSRSEGRSERN